MVQDGINCDMSKAHVVEAEQIMLISSVSFLRCNIL